MSPGSPGRGGRTLFVSSFAPVLGNGRALRTYTLVRALAALGPLDVAYVPFGARDPDAAFLALDGVEFERVTPSRGARRIARWVRLRAEAVPPATARAASSPELVEAISRLAAVPGRGRVVAADFNVMLACMGLARRRPVVYSAQNVESSYSYGDSAGRFDTLRMRLTERRALAAAAESWMVSRRDVALAQQLMPRAQLRYVPNVVDVGAIVPVAAASGPSSEVLMVGDYTYAPNATGAAWLADEIMPRVWASRPDVRLTLVGRGAEDVVTASDRVDTPGFVDDLNARYGAAGVVAVPLLQGGGTPLKFVEALAHGVPVVATQTAAQGLELAEGQEFRRADDAAAFAAQLLDVLALGAPDMAARARARVESDYSLETMIRLLRD